jgi:muramoyltetrapeptide carboxypeptidase
MIRPALLQPGDTIAIVSPAKSIEAEHIHFAKAFFEQKGLHVLVGEHAFGQHNYFSGTDEQRLHDFQLALDNPDVKAIICARGGYGCVRIVEQLQWASLLRDPKWIVGFSDVTVLHQKALRLGVESIHATMPLNYRENTPEALDSLWQSLTAGSVQHEWATHPDNRTGSATGTVIGGNLSILYSLLATPLNPPFEGAILFIEDVGEQLYHIDRIFQTLKLSGALDRIGGLIVGGMTDMRETATPTGLVLEELILDQLRYRRIPVAFQAPVGHIPDNRAMICGAKGRLEVTESSVIFSQSCKPVL